jgi:crotonobetainyl-CoA:carnitine CoA-transferase CaiB-like acyl-CoA transferase
MGHEPWFVAEALAILRLIWLTEPIAQAPEGNAMSTALGHLRICDFTGQLAGAGATKFLAAFGAQVIRIEDPVRRGRWDILRGMPPYVDHRRGGELGGAFNNHNTEKLGITLNLKTERGRELVRELIKISDVVSENFAAGVLTRLGFDYETMQRIKPDIIYVSNCGFGHEGPYGAYKTWGPIVQAMSGLTFGSGLPGQEPAGYGFSYMDHTGAYYMAMAIMLALHHRHKTGEGQWVDMAATEAGAVLNGPAMLDYTVNGRPLRREGSPDANHSQFPPMAPHNIYQAEGDDEWVSIACRNEDDWAAIQGVIDEEWARDACFATLGERLANEADLDAKLTAWTQARDKFAVQQALQSAGVPAAAVQRPGERVDEDPNTEAWGLWPTVRHQDMGLVRVDGIGAHMSQTDWSLSRGGPVLGEHNRYVLQGLLHVSDDEYAELETEGVI